MFQVLPSINPHHTWLTHPDPGQSCVRVRLYWHTAPLLPNLIQDLLRAVAARALPMANYWCLSPDRPWLTAARRLAGAGLLPIPPRYEPAAHFAEYRRILPAHPFLIEAGINAVAHTPALAAVERALLWLSDILQAQVLFFTAAETIAMATPLENHAPEPEIIAPPPQGKPHPLSDSEQTLARYIAKDPQLSLLTSWCHWDRSAGTVSISCGPKAAW
jgi:hypothetical protein